MGGQGAMFTDVEGTLIRLSMPSVYVRKGLEMGLFSKRRVIWAGLLTKVGKWLPASSALSAKLRYVALLHLMQGTTLEDNQRVIRAMMPEILDSIKPEMRLRLEEAKAAGMPIVLVSAALHEAVAVMGDMLGARGEGTKVEIRDGRLTGKGYAPANGPRKAERVQRVAAELGVSLADSAGYGDTEPDTAFLALMGRAVAVDPDAGLRREALERGWEILETTP